MNSYSTYESDYTSNPQLVLQSALAEELQKLNESLDYLLGNNLTSERDLHLLRGLVSLSQFTVQQAVEGSQQMPFDVAHTLENLQEEAEYLRAMNAAYQQQVEWFKSQAALSKAATGRVRMKATMKQCLQSTLEITGAETGSIFLVSQDLVIQDYLLLRENTTEDERLDLVGKVLKKGLAGWVAQKLTAALIPDTRSDSRWIDFPDQPYVVRSALCVPMLRDQHLVGILTLTHPERYYFTEEEANLAWTIAYQTALVMETNRLLQKNNEYRAEIEVYQSNWDQLVNGPLVGSFILKENRFVQVNKRLSGLMGYSSEELLNMKSISSLIAYEDRNEVNEAIQKCVNGHSLNFNLSFGITRKNGQLVKVMAQGIRRVDPENGNFLMGIMDSIA
ncbi:MAG: GAF domain-containing protein [Prochlorotrichaceae cyanobacterium]|jgi:PAS domain S-box-containing protein